MIRPPDGRSAYHSQGNKEAGQKPPGAFAFYDPGPQLQNFTKEICFKNKALRHKPTTRLTRREFCKADFFGASPVASALDLCMGATPIRRPSLYHVRFAARITNRMVASLAEISLSWHARTCRIHSAQVKTVKQH